MYNCIYGAHCTQAICDKSCPTLAQTTYLLERNNISMSNEVFRRGYESIDINLDQLAKAEGKIVAVGKDNTVLGANILTYCGICQKWKGSRLHCTVYNLQYAQYIEAIKKSWSTTSEPEQLEYMKIWSASAELLIISNLDYVNFKDFESQTLLTLLQSRTAEGLTTIIVVPKHDELIGTGLFFNRLHELIKGAKIK